MSAEFFSKLQQLGERMDAALASVTALGERLESVASRIEEVDGDRKALRREMKDMSGKVETLHALRETIEKDAREILGTKRDVIDPTKVKMPGVLKTLGYGSEARK